ELTESELHEIFNLALIDNFIIDKEEEESEEYKSNNYETLLTRTNLVLEEI
ncbi:845_t:CDS:1, partial [Scutellospora calospora]